MEQRVAAFGVAMEWAGVAALTTPSKGKEPLVQGANPLLPMAMAEEVGCRLGPQTVVREVVAEMGLLVVPETVSILVPVEIRPVLQIW